MKYTKKEKVEKSKELAVEFGKTANLFFADFQGLKFQEMAELRSKVAPMKGRFQVLKNSMLRFALKGAGFEGAKTDLFKGQTAMLLAPGEDPVAAAKVLAAFAKQFPAFKFKAGWVGGAWLGAEDVKKLSALATKPELLTKLASVLYGAMANMAAVLAAPARDLAMTLKALEAERSKAQAG